MSNIIKRTRAIEVSFQRQRQALAQSTQAQTARQTCCGRTGSCTDPADSYDSFFIQND